jgi:hypothetical protein
LAEFPRLLLGLFDYRHKDLVHYHPVFSNGPRN